jgi:hypothetical protein
LQRFHSADLGFKPGAFFEDFLGAILIFPQLGVFGERV